MKLYSFIVFFFIIFLSACSNKIDNPEIDKKDPYLEAYDSLFSLDKKISITIDISENELKKINDDYIAYNQLGMKSDIYRYANSITVKIDEEEYRIQHVGVRMKGNTSLRSFINSDKEMYNLVHFRLSFKQTFDKKDKDILGNPIYSNPMKWTIAEKDALKNRTVFGLEALEMKYNKELDSTYTREIYTSELFRQNGVLAQKMNLAEIKINSKENGSLGLYRFAEVIDEYFIKRNFSEENQNGDLYKAGWGSCGGADFKNSDSNCHGVETPEYTPTYDLKTNKKTSNHASLINLLRFLNQNTSINNTFDNYFNLDYFISLQALYFMIGDPDSLRYNSNNFYIYFTPSGRPYIIPYDYERTFGAKATWNPIDAALNLAALDWRDCWYNEINNQLVIKTIKDNSRLQSLYLNKIEEIKNSEFYSFSTYEIYYNRLYSNYNRLTHASYQLINQNLKMSLYETNNYWDSGCNYSVQYYFDNKKLS